MDNHGNGNVYGMYGYGGNSETFNAYVVGKDSEGNENKKPAGVGNIIITDNGSGTVYGMYSQISDITQYKEAINATGWNEGTATGNIDINHIGGGVTYGILGDVRAYNTFIAQMGKAYGNINITGDDDIYGISGYVAATNVVNYWYGDYGEGNIILNEIGNGDVYGMMINKDNVPGAGGTGQSWFAFNAYVGVGGSAFGNIDIHNYGDGNAYGMYGGQQLYNAKSFGGQDDEGNPSGHPTGRISILNAGSGNAYGMYLPDEDETAENDSLVLRTLRQAGYERYEISNFSLPGLECRHNRAYWERKDYIGFGPGAASLLGNRRFTNTRDYQSYINSPGREYLENTFLTEREEMEEFMFLGLRECRGVDKEDFKRAFGRDIEDIFGKEITIQKERGFMEEDGLRYYYNDRGLFVSNILMSEFLEG